MEGREEYHEKEENNFHATLDGVLAAGTGIEWGVAAGDGRNVDRIVGVGTDVVAKALRDDDDEEDEGHDPDGDSLDLDMVVLAMEAREEPSPT